MPRYQARATWLLQRLQRRFAARPLDMLLACAAVVVTATTLILPFTAVRYPPLTDLPMHASCMSALRHWLDPAYHFQDQFELQPLRSPVITYYALGALLAMVLPIAWAAKLATAVMLSLLPIGLAVYCHGMKKNPTMGVAGAGLAWGTLTQWGFASFLAATGLTLMGVGLTFLVVERPTRARTIGLGVVTALVFFTHVSCVPPYLLAVGIVTAVMFPLTQCVRPVAKAVAPTAALFALWFLRRPAAQTGALVLHFDPSRVDRIPDWLLHSYAGAEEGEILAILASVVLGVAIYRLVLHVVLVARGRPPRPPARRAVHATVAAGAITAMFLAAYFVLPMEIGLWSLVYPREITVAALFGIGLLPGLPRNPWLRAPALLALLEAITLPARFAETKYAQFGTWERGLEAIIAKMPLAPKLGYIIEDRSGPLQVTWPMLHLPVWVQAERGGWVSFHFASWDTMPIGYRKTPPMDVPPPTPNGFEMNPEMFDVATRGKYFDYILVRSPSRPDARVAADPSLKLVQHEGWWWLYHR